MCIFHDNIALVTGGSSGIGRAIALALSSKGCTTCIIGRNQNSLDETAAEAEKNGSAPVFPIQADLEDENQVLQLSDKLSSFGHLDILVHSAGVFDTGFVNDASVQNFDWQYKVNVRAPYLLTQMLLKKITSCCGQIVFINSSAGLNAHAGVGQYAATKHALKALADSLRAEVNGEGVRVVSVYPGRTATPLMESLYRVEGKVYNPQLLLQPHDVAEVVVAALSLPRTAEVTDIRVRPMRKS